MMKTNYSTSQVEDIITQRHLTISSKRMGKKAMVANLEVGMFHVVEAISEGTLEEAEEVVTMHMLILMILRLMRLSRIPIIKMVESLLTIVISLADH